MLNSNDFLLCIRNYLSKIYSIDNIDKIIDFTPSKAKNAASEIDGSITFFNTPVFNLKRLKNNDVQILMSNRYKNSVGELDYSYTKSVPYNIRIKVRSFEDIEQLENVFVTAFENLTTKDIGCCSRYVQCSDCKKCVQPYADIYLHCAYRQNLLCGKIFYGKNKNI